jgi:hypothetical protein
MYKLRKTRCLMLWAACLWLCPAAAASGSEPDPAPAISLDKLLTLPRSIPVETSRRGGATRGEWKARFAEAEAAVVESREHLEKTLGRLGDLAGQGGNWKVSAPGQQAAVDDTTPMNFGLKQEINRAREEVTRTERELVDLKVEANLAGVPEEWWRPASESSVVDSSGRTR